MNTFLRKLKMVMTEPGIRNRVLAVLGGLIIFRLLSTIPVPGLTSFDLQNALGDDQFLSYLNIFAGGGLSSLSVIMLGVGPYITASIIMQLMTVLSPKLKALYHEEGQSGREKFQQVARNLTVPIAFIQGFGLLLLLMQQGIIGQLSAFQLITNLIVIVAGAMVVTWLGELMSEHGIGNGVSLLIFAGIVAVIPSQLSQLIEFTYNPQDLPMYLGVAVAAIAVIVGIVLVSEAERPVPVVYAKNARAGQTYGQVSTYIPMRVNQSGVMPIIFGISILMFPQFLAGFFAQSSSAFLQNVSTSVISFLNNDLWYGIVYFILVFLFAFFYTAITFDPDAMAENLQKSGAFVPGVRPGEPTSEYFGNVLSRITLVGGLFLAVVAVIPIIIRSITGISALAIGGTGLLIVVAVVIDLAKKIDSQISMREY